MGMRKALLVQTALFTATAFPKWTKLRGLLSPGGPAASAAATAWVLVRKCAQPNQNFALPQVDPGSTRRPAGDSLTPGSRRPVSAPSQSSGCPMRLEAAARMDVFRKLWRARKLIVVVFIPLSLLPLPLVHPTSGLLNSVVPNHWAADQLVAYPKPDLTFSEMCPGNFANSKSNSSSNRGLELSAQYRWTVAFWSETSEEACCAYVLMVTAVYWVSEAVPLGAAALVPAFLYPLFGVLKSSEFIFLLHQHEVTICQTRSLTSRGGAVGGGGAMAIIQTTWQIK
ncbi:hypothetical protein CCH79_00014313 [Gambusia affinis]|uniref:Uncharacterized protein n=1 Tax=Gambusia affinis TaxID=33528 RepID=A0A315US40_GAMAF|nr:hypothetical protein CCH79_00014313 [Gambusia affinis]